jgi:hypothetical protein
MKILFVIIILFSSLTTLSQVHMDFGGGAENIIAGTKDDNIPVMKISVGYEFKNNIVTEAAIQPALTRRANVPNLLGIKAGYNINGLIPSVGYMYNYRSSDNNSINGWEVAYALKYQFQLNDNGGLYIEGMYSKSAYQLTAGFHVQF